MSLGVVESRLEKADQAADAILAATYGDEPEPDPGDQPEGDKPVESAAPEGENVAADGVVIEGEDEPKPEAKPAEPPKEADDQTYKHRFEIMEGKYKAEVPRLSTELAQWKDFAGTLQARVAALEEAAKAKPAAPAEEPEADYEVDAFIADNPGAAKLIKKLEERHKSELASLRDEIKSVDSKAVAVKSEVQQNTAVDRFDRAMAQAGVSDWKEIDTDPSFMEWLNRTPYNLKVLQAAASDYDAATVSSFFLEYKKSLNPPDNGNGGEPPPDGTASQSKLEKFTAPPRSSGGGAPPKTAVQPALTKANYEKFMVQTTTGKYRPANWGGKTEAQMDTLFDAAIAKNELI